MTAVKTYKFLFAGGGTGGHLFPAVAVADKIKEKMPQSRILFIGTKSKIEGRVVPKLGYEFKSIWIKGFARKMNLENLLFPLKVAVSVLQSVAINMKFKPDVAIGSGGYVSGPAIYGASIMGAKIILLEQNSYPGITTRILEKFADETHVAFNDSKKYLRKKDIIKVTGNPVRNSLTSVNRTEAVKRFHLSEDKKTLLVLGGSLGAASINKAVAENIKRITDAGIQIIWQCGKNYYQKYKHLSSSSVFISGFIDYMNFAYSACDVLVARAGATTIAELLALGIPSILVPSPHVAENHQFYNAKSLTDNEAAIMIEDNEISQKIFEVVTSLFNDENKINILRNNSLKMARPNAADIVAESAIKLAVKKNERYN